MAHRTKAARSLDVIFLQLSPTRILQRLESIRQHMSRTSQYTAYIAFREEAYG